MAPVRMLPPGTIEVTLPHGGRERSYFLHAPSGAGPGAPLVLELHGRGIPPLMFDRWTGYSDVADVEGFVLAMPAALGEIWNDGRFSAPEWGALADVDDVGYLLGVIDDVVRRHAIDRTRVYLVGMSNGAAMAGRLAWEQPERVAGLAQVAGTAGTPVVREPRPTGSVPVIQIHGTSDRWAPYDGGQPRGLLPWLVLRRRARPSVSVDEWARLWVHRNGATQVDPEEAVATDVTVRRWRGTSPASEVVFYRVDGGGHTWPGVRMWTPPHLGHVSPSLDATGLTWEFLKVRRREP